MTFTRLRLRRLLRFVLLAAAVVVLLAVAFFAYLALTAPQLDLSDVSPDRYRTTILDDAGQEMIVLVGEESNRVYVTLDQIPKQLQDAFIAIEDERFYQHHGVDLRGVARAVWRNLRGGSLQGASTITQQLLKNNVFTDWMQESTFFDKVQRKLQEQYLALQLERQVDKDWILENYLNTINLGGGTWGVETAAQRYFGKSVSDLTLSECAVLAAIAKSPTGYNPLTYPEANRTRQLLVLDKMLQLNRITQEEYDEARMDKVHARVGQNSVGVEIEVLSYFEDALVYQVLDDLIYQLGCTEEEAWQLIYRGGLTIHSTQNTALQTLCEQEINRDDLLPDGVQASIVMMDPATGQVKAIVGGRGEKSGSLSLNRAISSLRQPGSTIKVVGEYAAALSSGDATLGTVYDDAPCTYSDGTPIRNAGGTYAGRTTVRSAIASSLNTVALQCFQQVGMDAVWQQLSAFGFAHLTDADRVEALALGGTSGGVTNLEMTAAYAAIANGGTYCTPAYYTQVLNREGNLLLTREPLPHTAVDARTAALLTDAMEDVLRSGTGTAANFSGMALAGKSGTTTDLRDLWFVGYSPYYACGVWCGYDDFSPQTGSGYVKTLWKSVMQRSHETLAPQDFSLPEDFSAHTICTKCGDLAVEGLCDATPQGDKTAVEYFAPGTAPTDRCTCHITVTVCSDSGQRTGTYCPSGSITRQIYLRTGTAGTADEAYALPDNLRVDAPSCEIHDHWWSWFFPSHGEESPEELPEEGPPVEEPSPAPQDPPQQEDRHWWDWLW